MITRGRRRRARSCTSPGWHASTTRGDDGCTNDDSYPPEWDADEHIRARMFFDTAEECCKSLSGVRECRVYDEGCRLAMTAAGAATAAGAKAGFQPAAAAASRATTEPACAWHPSMTGGHVCAYSSKYPPDWANPEWRHNFLFDDHAACCQGALELADCGRQVMCQLRGATGSPTTGEPTGSPTRTMVSGITHTMTPPPTPNPPPSPAPTSAPTSIYFIEHFTGVCHDASVHVIPHYITDTYTDIESCCDDSFAKEKCLSVAADQFQIEHDDGQMSETYHPTYAPTDIIYYVDHFTGKCINSIDAPMPHWVVNDATKQFTDFRECCEASFFMKEECLEQAQHEFPPPDEPVDYTADPTLSPSMLPSGQPSLPTVRPTEDNCTDDKWRYDPDYVDGCTNLASGDNESDGPNLLFQSWKECCQRFFARGNHCRVDDRCSISTTMISFESRPRMNANCMNNNARYHPDVEHKDGCTNSASFPATWLELPAEEQSILFFSTVEHCCQTVYLDKGYNCNVRNICGVLTAPPTNSPTKTPPRPSCSDQRWHPDIDSDSDGCSNSEDVPDSWKTSSLRETMLFSTAEACCEAHYAVYGLQCYVNDVCNEETQSVSRPSFGGTHSTFSTASSISTIPACSSRGWHPNQDFSECTNDDWEGPSSLMFNDAAVCCMNVFNYPNCPMDDVCTFTGPATTSSISSCESHKWHPNMDFSKCTNDDWEGPSSLMFNDAAVCCMNVFNYANCPTEDVCASHAAVVTPSPSSRPTPIPTPTPTTQSPTPTPTQSPTQSPTPNPTPAPSTKMPSLAPINDSNTLDDSGPTIPCSWRTMVQCKSRLCIWDTSKNSCVKLSPTPAILMVEAPSDRCGENNKRQCANDVYCSWDAYADSCTCESRMYHPRSAHDRTCSNDANYPELWNEPTMRDDYFFTSGLECCSAHYKDGSCKVVDVCLYCNGRKWHPITATDRICTNSDEYPPLWDIPPHSEVYLLNSASECCAAFYGDGKCNEIDVCDV